MCGGLPVQGEDHGIIAAEAVALMNKHNITGLFVAENGRPVGIIHIHDCLRAGIV